MISTIYTIFVILSDLSLADTYEINCPLMTGVRYWEVSHNIEDKWRYGFPIAQLWLGEGQGVIYAYKADKEGNTVD